MERPHRDAHLRLEDYEKLRLYAQLAVSKHHALDDALVKAKAKSKHWMREAKAGAKIVSAKKEGDEAKEEAQLARIVAVAMGDAKVRVEDDLDRVQDALSRSRRRLSVRLRLRLPA